MSKFSQRMLARFGAANETSSNSKFGKLLRRRGVADSPELKRVKGLPRRVWEETDTVTQQLTEALKTPNGEQTLRHIQAISLEEMHDLEGLFGPIRVGAGKTLITYLAPTVLEAERPLLLVPAKLKDKTHREFEKLSKHWKAPVNLRIESYELMGRERGAELLEEINPDLIIADECHKLKNPKAAVTRRVRRWMGAHATTRFVALSGTITSRSLRDFWHIIMWCLPRWMPLPRPWPELSDWADALDEKVEDFKRMAPGALLQLTDETGQDELGIARRAFQGRLIETPGVVATRDKNIGCSLMVSGIRPELPSEVYGHLERLRNHWETPDGQPVMEAVDVWRHARELICGFFYRWDPEAPKDWMAARKAWFAFVREVLAHSRTYDSPLQVANACQRGDLPDQEYAEWAAIRDSFEPNSVPVWVDNSMIEMAAHWLKKPGICWVEHVAFGERLSALSGVPYFGRGGKDKSGVPIEEMNGLDPIIASIASNSEGRNLQAWNRNLVVSCPPNGKVWEQLLGRTHRDGQEADTVEYEVVMACAEQIQGMQQALQDASYIQNVTGQDQKLLYADRNL